jgi:hypothetical protein
MPIQTDWTIDFNTDALLNSQPGSMGRLLSKPSVRAEWEAALEEGRRIIQPAATWEIIPVREYKHDRLVMQNGAVLTGGPFAQVMAGAQQLIVGVCTAGGAIVQAAATAKKNGAMMRAMFLDTLAIWAVGSVRQQLVERFEAETKASGLHISTMLSPGESEWPISQQAELFSLVDASRINVSLTSTMMMNPMKSLSLVMGIGPDPLGSEGATNCDFCTMRETCPHSQAGTRQPLAA